MSPRLLRDLLHFGRCLFKSVEREHLGHVGYFLDNIVLYRSKAVYSFAPTMEEFMHETLRDAHIVCAHSRRVQGKRGALLCVRFSAVARFFCCSSIYVVHSFSKDARYGKRRPNRSPWPEPSEGRGVDRPCGAANLLKQHLHIYICVVVATTQPQRRRLSMKTISTPNAPAAVGPYAQGNIVNGLLFASGQIALVPETGELAGDTHRGSEPTGHEKRRRLARGCWHRTSPRGENHLLPRRHQRLRRFQCDLMPNHSAKRCRPVRASRSTSCPRALLLRSRLSPRSWR